MNFQSFHLACLALLIGCLSTAIGAEHRENSISERLAAEKNLTVENGYVVIPSLIGNVLLPVPPSNELQLTHGRVKRDLYSHSPFYVRDMADFFSCSEQAQYALSPFGDNARNWDAFFKRNSINNTMAVSTQTLIDLHAIDFSVCVMNFGIVTKLLLSISFQIITQITGILSMRRK